jgi:hypothetical protein
MKKCFQVFHHSANVIELPGHAHGIGPAAIGISLDACTMAAADHFGIIAEWGKGVGVFLGSVKMFFSFLSAPRISTDSADGTEKNFDRQSKFLLWNRSNPRKSVIQTALVIRVISQLKGEESGGKVLVFCREWDL